MKKAKLTARNAPQAEISSEKNRMRRIMNAHRPGQRQDEKEDVRTLSQAAGITKTHDYNMEDVEKLQRNYANTYQLVVFADGHCVKPLYKGPDLHSKEKSFKRSYKNTDCGIQKSLHEYGFNYTATVLISYKDTSGIRVSRKLPISGAVLKRPISQVRYRMWTPNGGLPTSTDLSLPLNSQFSFELLPTVGQLDHFKFVFVHPRECNIVLEKRKETFLSTGCPAYGRDDVLLSSVFQSDTNGEIGAGLVVNVRTVAELLPSYRRDRTEKRESYSLECSAFVCTGHRQHRIAALPLCPSVAPCETVQPGRTADTMHGKGVKLLDVALDPRLEVNLVLDGALSPYEHPLPLPPSLGQHQERELGTRTVTVNRNRDVNRDREPDLSSATKNFGTVTLVALLVCMVCTFAGGLMTACALVLRIRFKECVRGQDKVEGRDEVPLVLPT